MTHTVRLPKGWTLTTLGEFGRWSSGGTPSRSRPESFGGNTPWIKTGDLQDCLITSAPESISESGLKNSSAKLFPVGTLLIAMYGATIGKLGLLGVEASTNQACAALLPDECIHESIPYVFYYLMSVRRDLKNAGKGGAQPNISQTVIKKFPMPLAPPQEQHRIVAAIESYLTRLDDAVALLERAQQNLKRYRASVLKAAVEGRLVPTEAELAKKEGRSYEPASELLNRILVERRKKWIEDTAEKARAKTEEKARKADKPWTIEDDAKTLEKERAKAAKKYKEPAAPDLSALGAQAGTSNLPDLPEGWCWCTLGQLVWLVKDGPHYSPEYVEEGIPFITGGNVRPEGVDFDSAKRISPKLHKELCQGIEPEMGDMLYTKGGTTGIARVNTYNRAFSVWVHVAVLKLAQPIDAFYVQNALNSPWCYSQSQLYTHGVGNQDLGLTRMVNITIPLPPLAEQRRVNEFVARTTSLLVDVANAVKTGRERSRALRQSILKWAFEGKLVPQDPEDEPASALLERIKAERESMQPRTKRRTNKRKDEPTKHDEQLDLLGGSNK